MKTESKSRLEDTRTWSMPATETGELASSLKTQSAKWDGDIASRRLNCSGVSLTNPECPCIMPETFLPKPSPMKDPIMNMFVVTHYSSSGIYDLPQSSQNTDTTALCFNRPTSSSIV